MPDYDTNIATGNMWWIMTADIVNDSNGSWVFRFSKNRAEVINEQKALEQVFASSGGLTNVRVELVNDDTKQYFEDRYNSSLLQ